MSLNISFAIIGGSGMYSMSGLTDIKEYDIKTPFGKPSAPIVVGTLEGRRVAFLARHGIGHHIMPSEVPYRANIFALKSLGIERIVSINACGSLREDYAPGQIVIPNQIFDNTKFRIPTFFGEGLVAHIGTADPFCPNLSATLEESVRKTGATVHHGGAFLIVEGPRFSTKAESNTYRSWGMAIIGMTCAPEAFLAREAELCYAVMAHITDFDVWHVNETPVTVDMVIQILNQNTEIARQGIRNLVQALAPHRTCSCGDSLATAIITNPTAIPPETLKKLDLLVGKYVK